MTPPRCDTGACLQVHTDGDATILWETAQPDIRVVTTTVSWQSWLDQARAEERAAIAARLRRPEKLARDLDINVSAGWGYALAKISCAIEAGKWDGLVAGDE